MEFLDYLVILEDKVPRDQLDSQDSQEPMERKVDGAPPANLDQEDSEAQRVLEESAAREASQANRDQRATLVVMAPQVLRERGVPQALKDPQGFQAQKAPQVHQGKMGCQATPGREVKRVSKARRVLPVLQELSGRRVLLGKLVQWVNVAIQVLQGHQVNRGSLGYLERKEQRGTRDLLVFLEKMGHLV